MTDHLISQRFDDIYFSRQDGLAETRHVFLNGNHLPERWAGCDRFTIAETGFGTGLNFLSAWKLFDETAGPGAVLDFISFELYPLAAREIEQALDHWRAYFGGRLEELIQSYPLRIPGWHRLDFMKGGIVRIRLTLIFDDVNAALPRVTIPSGVDAWFLDGFAPAKNPQMWNAHVFQNMARLSRQGATLSSFTAAGLVRNGLREAGFAIQKTRGFGRKRDMITGAFAGDGIQAVLPQIRRVAVVGGGLAGTACAMILRGRGIGHVLFEAGPELAGGASGNRRGIFNPRFMAQRNAQSDFYSSAFALAARTVRGERCGSLHLLTDADKERRLRACCDNWGWHEDHMVLLDAKAASEQAGIELSHAALYLPDSGQVSPRDLCHGWAAGSDIRLNAPMTREALENFDAVILACGAGVRAFFPDLPLETVRGQVIEMAATPQSAKLRSNLCYGGYIGPACDGVHMVGSSFQKWLTETTLRDEDTRDILDKLSATIPGLRLGAMLDGRAALRCAAKDRFPVIGRMAAEPRFLITAAHGSHGIVSALEGAHLLGDILQETPYSLPHDSVDALSPQRFQERAGRKQQASCKKSGI